MVVVVVASQAVCSTLSVNTTASCLKVAYRNFYRNGSNLGTCVTLLQKNRIIPFNYHLDMIQKFLYIAEYELQLHTIRNRPTLGTEKVANYIVICENALQKISLFTFHYHLSVKSII